MDSLDSYIFKNISKVFVLVLIRWEYLKTVKIKTSTFSCIHILTVLGSQDSSQHLTSWSRLPWPIFGTNLAAFRQFLLLPQLLINPIKSVIKVVSLPLIGWLVRAVPIISLFVHLWLALLKNSLDNRKLLFVWIAVDQLVDVFLCVWLFLLIEGIGTYPLALASVQAQIDEFVFCCLPSPIIQFVQ